VESLFQQSLLQEIFISISTPILPVPVNLFYDGTTEEGSCFNSNS
jgi:hypothetical protein